MTPRDLMTDHNRGIPLADWACPGCGGRVTRSTFASRALVQAEEHADACLLLLDAIRQKEFRAALACERAARRKSEAQ